MKTTVHTRDTPLNKLRPRELKPLQDMLDIRDKYKVLASSIRKRSGAYLYSPDEIEGLANEYLRQNSTPTKAILSRWRYDNPSLCDLVSVLTRCKLLREAEYVIGRLLGEPLPSFSGLQYSDDSDEETLTCPCMHHLPLRPTTAQPQQHDETPQQPRKHYQEDGKSKMSLISNQEVTQNPGLKMASKPQVAQNQPMNAALKLHNKENHLTPPTVNKMAAHVVQSKLKIHPLDIGKKHLVDRRTEYNYPETSPITAQVNQPVYYPETPIIAQVNQPVYINEKQTPQSKLSPRRTHPDRQDRPTTTNRFHPPYSDRRTTTNRFHPPNHMVQPDQFPRDDKQTLSNQSHLYPQRNVPVAGRTGDHRFSGRVGEEINAYPLTMDSGLAVFNSTRRSLPSENSDLAASSPYMGSESVYTNSSECYNPPDPIRDQSANINNQSDRFGNQSNQFRNQSDKNRKQTECSDNSARSNQPNHPSSTRDQANLADDQFCLSMSRYESWENYGSGVSIGPDWSTFANTGTIEDIGLVQPEFAPMPSQLLSGRSVSRSIRTADQGLVKGKVMSGAAPKPLGSGNVESTQGRIRLDPSTASPENCQLKPHVKNVPEGPVMGVLQQPPYEGPVIVLQQPLYALSHSTPVKNEVQEKLEQGTSLSMENPREVRDGNQHHTSLVPVNAESLNESEFKVRSHSNYGSSNYGSGDDVINSEEQETSLIAGACQHYPYEVLSGWTNDFKPGSVQTGGSVIGRGGFAQVYLGKTEGGLVAVKRMKLLSDDVETQDVQKQQFTQEFNTLARLRHDNVLLMYGNSCNHDASLGVTYLCIVYEYMANGSLEDRLACKNASHALSVAERLGILRGAAEGIIFLHQHGRIHRDIKCANILLSSGLTAKIGDFGLVKDRAGCDPTKSFMETETVTGTKGYMPPEYLEDGHVSEKMDAFAFGVVLLEVLTGLPCYDPQRKKAGGQIYLKRHVLEHCASGDLSDLVDSTCVPGWPEVTVKAMYGIVRGLFLDDRRLRSSVTQIQPQLEALKA